MNNDNMNNDNINNDNMNNNNMNSNDYKEVDFEYKEKKSEPESTETAEDKDTSDEYEKVCYICRRTESRAGKMINMPGNMCVCQDCMKRSLDAVSMSNISYDDMLKAINSNDLSGLLWSDWNNLGNMNSQVSDKQKIKKKKSDKSKPIIDKKDIPAPHIIKGLLDEYVVGQEQAKKALSVAVYNHYKRLAAKEDGDIEIEKSNVLMIGPTGSGKTYLVRMLAKILQVPLAIADATSLTEAGYIGDDVESVVSKLLAAADNDVERAEQGIIFIDEIDKIAKKKETRSRDVSGESVQQGLLKLLEGSEIEVPVGATSKNAMVPLMTVNTKNILFICGGAFPDLEGIVKERLNQQSSIGFIGELKDKYDNDPDILSHVTVEDLRTYGMIPEFIGRLPVVLSLQGLTEEMLVKIMKEPKSAILKQYVKLLAMDEVELRFSEDALMLIAKKAMEMKTGARALRSILEEYMLDVMYEIPKDSNIGSVTITKEYIEKTGAPIIGLRGCEVPVIE